MSDPTIADFYFTLGVVEKATTQEIKKAYRNLALQHHPDKNPSPLANQEFQKISAAYETLSDEMKRLSYDEALSATKAGLPREEEKATKGEGPLAKEATSADKKEEDEKAAVNADKKGEVEVDEKKAVEVERGEEEYLETPEVAKAATSRVDDDDMKKALEHLEELKLKEKAAAEEKARTWADGSQEAAAQEAPKERTRNPDEAAARFPDFLSRPPVAAAAAAAAAASGSKTPRPSVFPNRPTGPIPRPRRADRAATRFPVVPQAAHLAAYKLRHPSPEE